MSENKYLIFISEEQAKIRLCPSGWYIHETKVKKIEKERNDEVLSDLHFIVNGGSVESEREEIIKKWEARSK